MNMRLALIVPVLALLSGCGSDDYVATTTADNTAYITDSRPPAPPLPATSRPAVPNPVENPHVAAVPRPVGVGSSYSGRVLYRSTKTPAAGLTVDLVEARGDGKPTDQILGTAHADEHGHFTVASTRPAEGKVALVASAVRVSANSGGDRTQEGYEVKSQRTALGSLPFPDPTKSNTLLIDRRQVQPPAGE